MPQHAAEPAREKGFSPGLSTLFGTARARAPYNEALELPERDQMARLANLIKQHLGHDFNTSVATYYHATLENAFSTAYDPKHLSNTFGFDHLPEITKPCQIITLNASMPKALIQFYEKNILGESDRSLWSEISKTWPDKLMQMLSLVTSAFNDRGLSIPSRLRGIHSLWISIVLYKA